MARPASRGGSFLLCGLVLLLILFPVLEDMARPMLLITFVALVFVTGVIVVRARHRTESGRQLSWQLHRLGLRQWQCCLGAIRSFTP